MVDQKLQSKDTCVQVAEGANLLKSAGIFKKRSNWIGEDVLKARQPAWPRNGGGCMMSWLNRRGHS